MMRLSCISRVSGMGTVGLGEIWTGVSGIFRKAFFEKSASGFYEFGGYALDHELHHSGIRMRCTQIIVNKLLLV